MKRVSWIMLIIRIIGAPPSAYSKPATNPYPNSLDMTCAQAKAYIEKNDGAILATGNAYASFHSSYCSGQPAYVRTKDSRFCYVGQYCDCELAYCAQSYIQGTDN
jgi:hypothetical protein